MKIGRNRMRGWRWTSQGWQKTPRRPRRVKSAAKPIRSKPRRTRRVGRAARKSETRVDIKTLQVAKERSHADPATIPATPPTRRSPRGGWNGKYDDLATPTTEKR